MRKLLTAAVLVLLTAPFLLPETAKAEAAFQFRFSGDFAFARFSSVDPTDRCVITSVSIIGRRSDATGQGHQPPGPPAAPESAGVGIYRFNDCTGEELLDVGGSTDAPNFQIDGKLTSASLTATITVNNFESGLSFDVFVDAAWTGIGDVARAPSHYHVQEPGLIINAHFNFASRQADASGSVSDGVTDFTAGKIAGFADLFSEVSGEVQVWLG